MKISTIVIIISIISFSVLSCVSDTSNTTSNKEDEKLKAKQDSIMLVQAIQDSLQKDSLLKVEALATAEEAKRVAEEKKLEEERIALERKDSIRREKKLLAEKKRKEREAKAPKITFEKVIHNFGTIKEGDVVKYEFHFKNTGKGKLEILDATATCGCTAPGYNFLPINPGAESAISVTYNSKNKKGPQRPEITVRTNAYPKSKYILKLEGVVEPAE